jgi:hypothetical protein
VENSQFLWKKKECKSEKPSWEDLIKKQYQEEGALDCEDLPDALYIESSDEEDEVAGALPAGSARRSPRKASPRKAVPTSAAAKKDDNQQQEDDDSSDEKDSGSGTEEEEEEVDTIDRNKPATIMTRRGNEAISEQIPKRHFKWFTKENSGCTNFGGWRREDEGNMELVTLCCESKADQWYYTEITKHPTKMREQQDTRSDDDFLEAVNRNHKFEKEYHM